MLDKLFQNLQPLIRLATRTPLTIIGISLVLAVAGFLLALNLRIDNDLSKLIPEDYPSVQALNMLREQVGGEHEAAVAISSPSFEANRRFGEALIPRALQLKGDKRPEPYFSRAEFRKEFGFLKNNALYFATEKELDLLEEYLNTKIDEAKEEANPFYFELEEEDETAGTDSLGEELNRQYDELVGSEYTMSADSTVLVVKLYPTGAQTDIGFIRDAYGDLEHLIAEMSPGSYHPEMEVAAAGRLLRTLIEIQTITGDVIQSFGLGVLMLMIAVVAYFFYKSYRARAGNAFSYPLFKEQLIHIPAHVLIIGLPLVVSLCWTFGIAWLAFGNLNIMTSTLGLLLFGMGIDFGIHFFARYSEERAQGYSVNEAILTTFMTTGQAIFAVGLTTSAAFFILMLADFKGFSEFGFIAGLGLLFAITGYLLFLPALIVLLEKSPLLNLTSSLPSEEQAMVLKPLHKERKAGAGGYRWKIVSLTVVAFAVGMTLLSFFKLGGLSFEYDFAELEPVYEEFNRRNRLVWQAYSDRRSRNAAYIIVDDPAEAPVVAAVLRARAEGDTASPTIRDIEVFQDRYPFKAREAAHKLERIGQIRRLLDDPFLKGSDASDLERLRQAAGTRAAIPLEEVPEFLKAPFTSASGTIGNLVIIYPSVGLADGRNSMAFADDASEVTIGSGKTYYAGSTSIVASDMLRLMIEEAPIMVILTVAFIVVFKLIILRGVKWMLLALLPLATSFIWLFGLMETVGWKLNFYNLVVLPTILGIGDDSGIHIVHRYLEEGKGSVRRVLHSTGEHITVSTLTTMLGFGGLLFSIHPGMRSIGEVAILGVGLALFAALVLLPALLRLIEKPDPDIQETQLELPVHTRV